MTNRSYRGLLWSLAVFGCLLDVSSKYGMFRTMYHPSGEGEIEVIPGVFRFVAQVTAIPPQADDWRAPLQGWNGPTLPRVNHGALFGLGNEYEIPANGFFMAVSIAAAIAISIWSFRPAAASDRTLCLALGMILGGTIGNLYDRTVFRGVRDFMHWRMPEWPVFNVADCLLVCGAGLLLLQAFWSPCAKRPDQTASEAAKVPELAGTK
jgi:lipoprotein signal peptidase